jgi:glycopeptide antibiotics resistance protein
MAFKPTAGLGQNRTDKIDIFVNILGFIPLGFFFALYFSEMKRGSLGKIYGYTLFTGFLTGLCIELLQMYLPTRNSNCVDLCMNTLGIFIGIALLHFSFQFEGKVFNKK